MEQRFEHILKTKLEDFSVKAEPGDWTRIERSLGIEKTRRVSLYRYVAAAAAVLLLSVGGFFLFNTDHPILEPAHIISYKNIPEKSGVENLPTISPAETEAVRTVLKIQETIDRANGRISTESNYTEQFAQAVPETPSLPMESGESVLHDQPETTAGNSTTSSRAVPSAGTDYIAVQSARNAYKPSNRRNRRDRIRGDVPNSNWGLALFADGSGGGSSNSGFQGSSYNDRASMSFPMLVENSGTALVNYEYDHKNGLRSAEMADWDHNLPLTFGFSVRKELRKNFGVEIGVSYSYLTSKLESSSVKQKLQLHYLGVPVSLTYTPLRTNNWEFYGRIGGAADFNIAGRTRTEVQGQALTSKFTKEGVQWSVSANVGAMYKISDKVGIYVEPGVGHYFEFNNQPESYWKEHPTNFNLKFGVRTNF